MTQYRKEPLAKKMYNTECTLGGEMGYPRSRRNEGRLRDRNSSKGGGQKNPKCCRRHLSNAPKKAVDSVIEAASSDSYVSSIRRLMTNPGYVLLLVTYGLNVGAFYAISTLLVCTLFKGQNVPEMEHYVGGSHT